MPNFYGAGLFYGAGNFYGPSDINVPVNLSFYRTSIDGVYVFYWGFSPVLISPALFTFDYELQLDTSPSFDSPNLVDFRSGVANDTTQSIPFYVTGIIDSTHLVVNSTAGMVNGDTLSQGANITTITSITNSTNLVVGSTVGWMASQVITYQNGNVMKGYAVPVAARIDGVVQTWYARVRIVDGVTFGPWSETLTWTIPEKVQQEYAEKLMESLPDYHVYGKGDLLKPVSQRNTNLWVVENMYGNQLDQVYYATYLTQTDNYIDLCVDEDLYQNFGVFFNFPKPNNMQYVDYRWILKNLILASLVGGTNEAVILTVQAFTGVPPTITSVSRINNFILTTTQDAPIIPSGPQTVFHTSTSFVAGTLTVQDLTTGLIVPSGSYTTNPIQGTWTMLIPTTDTLQAIFDTGAPIKVFDALQGATTLTGTVTFTNGSATVTGSGTLFLTELMVGQQITDPNGIYLGTIEAIASNISLTLVKVWAGPTETVTAYRLQYTDIQLPVPILWNASTLAWGVLITIFDPGHFAIPLLPTIESLVNQLVPANVKTYYDLVE